MYVQVQGGHIHGLAVTVAPPHLRLRVEYRHARVTLYRPVDDGTAHRRVYLGLAVRQFPPVVLAQLPGPDVQGDGNLVLVEARATILETSARTREVGLCGMTLPVTGSRPAFFTDTVRAASVNDSFSEGPGTRSGEEEGRESGSGSARRGTLMGAVGCGAWDGTPRAVCRDPRALALPPVSGSLAKARPPARVLSARPRSCSRTESRGRASLCRRSELALTFAPFRVLSHWVWPARAWTHGAYSSTRAHVRTSPLPVQPPLAL